MQTRGHSANVSSIMPMLQETVYSVVVDSLVLMKVERHARDQTRRNSELAQGSLLGLSTHGEAPGTLRVEVTNCFPHLPPPISGEGSSSDKKEEEHLNSAIKYQMDMMRAMRHIRIDHLKVGWYQCIWAGAGTSTSTSSELADKVPLSALSITREMLESQFSYQMTLLESVLLIFECGGLSGMSVRAFRLSATLMDTLQKFGYSGANWPMNTFAASEMFEAIRRAHAVAPLALEKCFIEVPVTLRISPLHQMLLFELERRTSTNAGSRAPAKFLTSSTSLQHGSTSPSAPTEHVLCAAGESVEGALTGTMAALDMLLSEALKQQGYLRQLNKFQNSLVKKEVEASGGTRNTAMLEECLQRARVGLAGQGRQPSLLEPMLLSQQLALHCSELESLLATSLGGLLAGSSLSSAPSVSAPAQNPPEK